MKAATMQQTAIRPGGLRWVLFAARELGAVLADGLRESWAALDLGERLRSWWWVVTNSDKLGEPCNSESLT